MTRNATIGTFGVTCIVFFRRHVETNEPIWSEPQVWTFSVDESEDARLKFEELKAMDHLFVPADGLTISSHK